MNEENRDDQTMSAFAILGINILSLTAYLTLVFSAELSDTVGAFFLLCHVLICVVFAINSKRPVWWVSACIVALPLISVVIS